MPRTLLRLPVPTGAGIAELLPRLAEALAGTGPALLPVPDSGEDVRVADALGAGDPLGEAEDDPDDPTAVVIATSGSTGEPKGTILSAGQLAASAAATEARLGGPGTWLLALPGWHIAGLQVLLRSLAAGTKPHLLDTGKPFTASRFTEASNAMPDGRRYVSLVPTQLGRILADGEATTALARFDAVLVGGAATAPASLDRARAAGVAVVTTYGMSETCGGCVYGGRPLDGTAIGLADGGRITLSGPMVARGYRGRPADPAFPRPGTFVTDDLGALRPDGTLTVLGRADDVIITGGHKVPPLLVEHALAELPGIAEAVVVGVPDADLGQRVTAVIVPAAGHRPDLPAIRQALALPRYALPRDLLLVGDLPHRGPGKPDRAAVAALAHERR